MYIAGLCFLVIIKNEVISFAGKLIQLLIKRPLTKKKLFAFHRDYVHFVVPHTNN